jgi:hypothetical protein
MSLHRNAKLGLAGRYALVSATETGGTLTRLSNRPEVHAACISVYCGVRWPVQTRTVST